MIQMKMMRMEVKRAKEEVKMKVKKIA